MSSAAGWLTASGFALVASLWLGATLPGAESMALQPDRASGTSLFGSACDHVAPGEATIASASLITDEILLDLLPPERLVAVSYVVDWPRATPAFGRFPASVPRTWGSAEHLLRLPADRVLLSEHSATVPAQQLALAGRCVVELPAPQSVRDVVRAVTLVGEATGTERRAAKLVAGLEQRLSRLPRPRHGPHQRAAVVQGSVVYAARTVQGDCLERAGYTNVASELGLEGTPALTPEVWLQLQLDVLFVAAPVGAPGLAQQKHLPPGVLWTETPVARLGEIIAVPETWVSSLSHYSLKACESYAGYRLVRAADRKR